MGHRPPREIVGEIKEHQRVAAMRMRVDLFEDQNERRPHVARTSRRQSFLRDWSVARPRVRVRSVPRFVMLLVALGIGVVGVFFAQPYLVTVCSVLAGIELALLRSDDRKGGRVGRTVIPRVPPPLPPPTPEEIERERLDALREMYVRDEISYEELGLATEQALAGKQPTHEDGRPVGRTSPFTPIASRRLME